MAYTKYPVHYIRLISATVLASGSMGLLGRMTTTAYPVIETSLNISLTMMQWVMAAPILSACSVILIGGKLGDLYGKRRMFNIGLLVFTVGILVSALSSSLSMLIIGQLAIGLGMALCAPACLSLIQQELDDDQQGYAIGLWAGLSGAFGVVGLIVGGMLIERFDWPSIFYSTLPFVIAAVIVVPKERRSSFDERTTNIDASSVLAIFLSIFFLVLTLIHGNQNRWNSVGIYFMLIAAAAFFFLVIKWQDRRNDPLIPLNIFQGRALLGANAGTFFIYFSLNGVYIFLVYHLQTFYYYPPTEAGWAMIPASLMVMLFAARLGKLAHLGKGRATLRLGTIVITLALIGLFFPNERANYFVHFFPFVLLLGVGMALFVSPLTTYALGASSEQSGLASGLNNLIARFSGILAVAVLGGVFTSMDEGVGRFRVCVVIMSASALIGTICVWVIVPPTNSRDRTT